ncbi:MAG TPA: M20 family peptidase [Gemmatimonadaceae bacterium]|nr:M20 family peptidase [Gemmatimonadaceae bacterium]
MKIRRVAAIAGTAFLLFVVVCVVRTLSLEPYRVNAPATDRDIANAAINVERFTTALTFPTISTQDSATFDPAPFTELHTWIEDAFPNVTRRLTREIVANYSLLYTWTGSDTTLDPILLMGHLDVVPVEPGTESRWTHPPFAGVVADSFVWGRGTLDDKASVVAILEAVEWLIGQGYEPRRTIYLAFGHDEELGGFSGAAEIAAILKARVGRLAFLVDEGGVVAEGLMPGVNRPVALVGVVEKGSMGVNLTVEQAGGHSSMPPGHTAVGILSQAITRLENNQMPATLTPVVSEMLLRLAPEMPFTMRFPMANLWAFRPVIVRALLGNPRTAAMLRTTTAATMVSGSPKENVLPIVARGLVNFRLLPGDTPEMVLDHVRRVVADTVVHVDGRGREASPVADYAAPEFKVVERTIGQLFPDAVPVPFLMIGGTDTRHYEGLTRNVYRFNPIVATTELVSGAHGTNERVRADDFVRAARFFAQLIRNAQ